MRLFSTICTVVLFSLPAQASTLNLTWVDNSDNEDSFVVERLVTPDVTWGEIAVVPVNTTNYTEVQTVAGHYCYRVKARNSIADSTYTNEDCADVVASAPPPPPPPVQYSLSISIFRQGSAVSSPSGINCPSACQAKFTSGTSVVLIETPKTGFNFSHWSGACSGQQSMCTVNMSKNRNVSATFSRIRKN